MFKIYASFVVAIAGLCAGLAHAATGSIATGSPQVNPGFACPPGMQWSTSTPPSCVPTMGGTASPIPCNGGTLNWAGAPGVTCQADVGAALNGIVKTVSSLNSSSGNASFTCTNGTWTKTGASTCIAAPCASGALSWTANGYTCSGNAATTSAGSTASVNASGATQGTASFTCSVSGAWGAVNPGATCAPGNCAGGAVPTWSDGGFVVGGGASEKCSGGALPNGSPGQTIQLTDTTPPKTGSASFYCQSGSWVKTDESCAVSAGCSATSSVSWGHGGPVFGGGGGAVCNGGPLPAGSAGQQMMLTDSTAPTTGNARYTCTNGVWSYDSTRTCEQGAAPVVKCPAANLGWYVGANYCNATASATSSGAYAFLSDASAPTTGTAYVACNSGTWGTPYSTTCNTATLPPTANCPAGSFSWTARGYTCNGYAGVTPAGTSVALADISGLTTGSAYVSCSGGIWSAPFSGTCNQQQTDPPAPAGCAATDAVLSGAGRGGIRYLMKAALSGFSTPVTMLAPFVYYSPSQVNGPGAMYAPQGDGNAPPVYCSGQATATCSGSTWTITPSRTPGLVPQCSSVN